MNLNCMWWLLLIPGILTFEQTKYELIFERLEVLSFDTSYVGSARTHNFKYNRTNAATTLTLDMKMAFGNELKLEVQSYRFASNEYREFPLRFMFDYCEYSAKKELGLNQLFACGNSTACPFKKGKYTSCTWIPNGQKFPPNIPAGSYKLDVKVFYRPVVILFLEFYGIVKYPECNNC